MTTSFHYPGENPERLRREGRPLWARMPYALRLITWYWGSRHARPSWVMLIVLLTIMFTGVRLAIWTNLWQRHWFDALASKDLQAFIHLSGAFFGVTAISMVALLIREYLQYVVAFRWRDWMTQQYLDKWMANRAYYRVESRGVIDNPDQRLTQDLQQFTESSLQLVTGLLHSVTAILSFGIVLWGLSGELDIVFAGRSIDLPGSLVFAAAAYALFGSWLVTFAGRNVVPITVRQERFEADFRFLLIHIRRGAEQLALYRGERSERERLAASFSHVRKNFYSKVLYQTRVAGAQWMYGQVDTLLPILLVMPRYFAGAITLGVVMQTRDAFTSFSSTLSWFTQAYPSILALEATIVRLRALEEEMDRPSPTGIVRLENSSPAVEARGLELRLPSGALLARVGDLDFGPGQRWLIRGASGVGKSSLLRAVAGLWTQGAGCIRVPDDSVTMFIPQRPYFPVGTLKEALTFPNVADSIDAPTCRDALQRVGLGHLARRLDDTAVWDRELSGGEQQRLAFGRALLQRPAVLFLDEATSALDPASEASAYRELLAAMPHLTLVSVAHRESLTAFHTHALELCSNAPALSSRLSAPGSGDLTIEPTGITNE